MHCHIFGDPKGEAAHNARHVCAVPKAVVRVVVAKHRVGMQRACACSKAQTV